MSTHHTPATQRKLLKAQSTLQVIHQGWTNLQVELHGQYSNQRLNQFHAYSAQQSWLRIALIYIVTPLPCLVLITVIDCIPLREPSDGPYANYVFWIRNIFTTTTMMFAIADQLRTFLPQLPLSTRAQVGVALLAPTAGVGQMLVFSIVIGFPAPFSPVIATPGIVVVIVSSLVWMWKDLLRANPSWWIDLAKYAIVVGTQFSHTVIYPAYVHLFNQLDGQQQAVFALVLPMIKMATKNIISRCLRGRDDIKPQGIILNVEIFNSLYVSMCMQTSTSPVTVIVLMSVDFIQTWLSLLDMSAWIKRVQKLLSKIPPDPSGSSCSLADVVITMIESRANLMVTLRSPAAYLPGRILRAKSTATVHPASTKNRTDVSSLNELPQMVVRPREATIEEKRLAIFRALNPLELVQLVTLTKQILFATEFLILIEYTEVMIPITYCVYISTVFYLPYRAFYPQTKNLDAQRLQQMLGTVAMYSALELVSFVAFVLILYYRLRLLGFHQLSFVLEKQWRFVQANLTVWMIYIVQSTLVHFGADFSMRFEWLRHNPSL